MYTTKRNYGIMPRTIGGLMEDVFQNGWNRINEELVALSAPVNITETETGYHLHLVAPGLKKEDLKISVDRGVLSVSYDHVEEGQEKPEGKWLRNEYRHKSFKRSFTLNDGVDASAISAKYQDGILQVSIPKREKSAPEVKEIAVQ